MFQREFVAIAVFAAAGAASAADTQWQSPRTPWGAPDLQGVWNVAAGTPLERPAELAGKEFFTDEELARATEQAKARTTADRRDDTASLTDLRREHNDFWFDKRNAPLTRRTSLIVDPMDGRLPPLTSEAAKQTPAPPDELRSTDGPEARGLGERCLVQPATGPPMLALPNPYVEQLLGARFQFQIVQNPDYVTIVWESITQARIIPLDGRPHVPETVRPWLGDSRGHWEGSTLVVETTNFPAKRIFLGLSAEHLRVEERFTRRDDNTLEYRFTVEDPMRWTRPWTGTVPVEKTDGRLFEFACHEGNYGLQNILRVARALEKGDK